MKKELASHLFFFFIFLLLVSLFHRYFTPPYILFWVGGLIGTALPDIDHLIYVYFLRPHELTSQRVIYSVQKGEIMRTLDLLATTRRERTQLIFHSEIFQFLFLALTIWVITSSPNIFARGLVLAFSLHLIVDQFIDLQNIGDINNWFSHVTLRLDREKALFYVLTMLFVLLFIAFLL